MTDQNSEARLAFIDIATFDDGSIRGGILVTDLDTRPYEFRVTSPIKPTTIQRVLYGKTLVDYVYGELIGLPLVKGVKEQLSMVIACKENLLVMRPSLSIPVIIITQSNHGIKNDGSHVGIEQIIVKSHKRYEGETDWAKTLLSNFLNYYDPFEPFERLRTAMMEVHKQRIGDQ